MENAVLQARRNRGAGGGSSSPQFFAKVDLLTIDNDSERKRGAKNINHIKFLENYW